MALQATVKRFTDLAVDSGHSGLGLKSQKRSGILGLFAIDNEDFADVLHRLRLQSRADVRKCRFALVAFHAAGAHFDEFVRRQRPVDFGGHRVGQALFADVDQRIEGMRARLERLAFARVYFLPLGGPLSL